MMVFANDLNQISQVKRADTPSFSSFFLFFKFVRQEICVRKKLTLRITTTCNVIRDYYFLRILWEECSRSCENLPPRFVSCGTQLASVTQAFLLR